MKFLFGIGLLMLGHAFYAAFSMQDELQAHHHGASATTAAIRNLVGSTEGASLPHWIVAEVLLGFCIAVIGYVSQASLHKIRLADHQSEMRYEHAVYTGLEFAHFNHRGSAISARQ